MTQEEKTQLVHDISQAVADRVCENGVCPLGLSADNARRIRHILAAAWWAGVVFAGTIIASVATGFVWLFVEVLKVFFDSLVSK